MAEQGKLTRFGRYLILDHLVDGGMAKICRARFLGEQADKVVAIKMIQPQFSADANFRKMFMDEIKVTFGLIHPNIAQTYDYGMITDQLFTAMEYIDGANLKQFMDRLKTKNFVFPVEISIHIITQVCQGLTYAHNFTDKLTGKQANIVHRDISPHNIMITYDGAVKIIDFGIAKAETNSESTKAGTIKGKLSYLAPEYLEGVELDHRYDQFAVGITLWELLCCRKLFQASNELAVLKLIQNCKVPPPSSINPNVPKELDQIVMKALSKDRELRFKDMDQFSRALVKTLYSRYPDFNALDLAAFANELFKDEIKVDRAKLIEYGKMDIAPYLADFKKEGQRKEATQTGVAGSGDSKTGVSVREEARKEIDLGEVEVTATRNKKDGSIVLEKSAPARKSPAAVTRTAAIQTPKGAGPAVAAKISESKRAATGRAAGNSYNPPTQVSANMGQKKASFPMVFMTIVGVLGIVYYLQKDSINQIIDEFMGTRRVPASAQQVKVEGPSKKEGLPDSGTPHEDYGIVQMNGLDFMMEIFVDNRKVEYEGLGLRIPLNRAVVITVRKKGAVDFTQTVQLGPENPKMKIDIPEMSNTSEGILFSSNNYKPGTSLSLEVNGKIEERELPIVDWRLPAGKYTASVKNEFYGTEKKVVFEIFENKRVLLPAE